jgi:hypothetical protein
VATCCLELFTGAENPGSSCGFAGAVAEDHGVWDGLQASGGAVISCLVNDSLDDMTLHDEAYTMTADFSLAGFFWKKGRKVLKMLTTPK